MLARGLDQRTVEDIVHKYAKEAQRLYVDLKQERERKILSIRHRLESELTDYVQDNAEWGAINEMVDQLVPRLSGVANALGIVGGVGSADKSRAMTINIETQVIGNVQGIVAREVSGNSSIGIQADELLTMIRTFGGSKAAQLASDVYELEDKDAKAENRLTARQRLKGFLHGLSGKASDKAVETMLAYVQSALGL